MSTPALNTRVVRFGPFEADMRTGELRKHGLRVKLQDQPFQILVMLIESRGELVTRDDIKERLWPSDTFVDFDHSVNTAIRRLRDALSDSSEDPHYVETLPRRGYRFVAPVESAVSDDHPLHAAERTRPTQGTTPALPEPLVFSTNRTGEPSAVPAEPPSRVPVRRRLRLATAGFIAVIAAFGIGFATLGFPESSTLTGVLSRLGLRSDSVSRIDSIAIIPFANKTGDPNFDYMADGLAESLIDSLSEVPGLRVVSRNSTFQLRDAKLTTGQVGSRVNARAVLIGSIQKANDGLFRMSVELVDAQGDRHLWGEEYAFAQCWPIEPMLARELYDVLRLKLDRAAEKRVARHETTSPAAYDAYLRGRFALRLRNRDSLQQAITHFQHAIDLDPNFGVAYAGLADALSLSSFYGGQAPRSALATADVAVRRALQLAPDRPMVRLTWAYQLAHGHHNLPAAIEEARRVVNANPNLAEARHALGGFLEMAGRSEEAMEQRRAGMALDPEWPAAQFCYLMNLLNLRRYQDARENAGTPFGKATVALYEQRYADAVAIYDSLGESPDLNVSGRAIAYARGGRRGEAEAMLRHLLDQRRNGYASPSDIAVVYFALGDRDNSFKWLNTAAGELDLGAAFLPHNPLLEPLHGDPRWTEFTRKMATPR